MTARHESFDENIRPQHLTQHGLDRDLLMAALAMLVWGKLSESLVWAIIMCLPLVLASFTSIKRRVAQQQCQSLMDFCVVCTFVAFVTIANDQKRTLHALPILLHWAPVLFYPMALCRSIGGIKCLELQQLIILFRIKALRPSSWASQKVDLSHLTLWTCVVSCSSPAAGFDAFYFPCIAFMAMLVWLFIVKQQRHLALTFTAGAFACLLGWVIQNGLQQTERFLTQQSIQWFSQQGSQKGLLKQSTMLGATASLQNSSAIVLRLKPKQEDERLRFPLYLRSSNFDQFLGRDTWVSSEDVKTLKASSDAWFSRFKTTELPTTSLTADMELWLLTTQQHWIPMPEKASALQTTMSENRERIGDDAIRMSADSDWLGLQIHLNNNKRTVPIPSPHRYQTLPAPSIPHLERALEKMSWSKEATLSESILKLKQFFHPFKYTLDLKAAPQGRHSLEHFLFHQQEGHCEYFATLTTLLLRQMGYLSRYCQGYVITEQDGPWAIARGRDAHAWAEVWDGEDWLKVETTPNANLSLSWTSHFMDPFNQLGFWLDQWRYQDGEDQLLNIAPWGLGVVVIYFFIRLLMEWRQFRERGHQRQLSKVAHDPGFIAIEKLLADKGMGRLPHESWGQWRDRLEQLNPHQPIKAELVEQWNQWAWGDPAFSDQVDFDLKTERRNIKQALRP